MYREVHHVTLEESTDLCDRFDFVSKFIWIQNDLLNSNNNLIILSASEKGPISNNSRAKVQRLNEM